VDEVQNFFDFLELIVNALSLVAGILIGAFTTGSVPLVYRLYRRAVLRRNWKADKPNHVREGLFPEWQDYEPEIPGIARRCVCHGRKLNPGERVLTWPETGPMDILHVAVYCESERDRTWVAR